jgi:ubiquinone/menaquinone biosynthesis C-methylase UbiE
MPGDPAPDVYTHGHHESVLRSHTWRTAENSAAYLLPHLASGQSLLDVGCGPGTITADLARRIAPGWVLGIDTSLDVVTQARRTETTPRPAGSPRRGSGSVGSGSPGPTSAGPMALGPAPPGSASVGSASIVSRSLDSGSLDSGSVGSGSADLGSADSGSAGSTSPGSVRVGSGGRDPTGSRSTERGRLSFAVGDAYALAAADASFDVVHAHQVLQHLTDPVAALAEMRRVLRPGGVLAVRDSDYGAFVWAPESPRLAQWLDLYHRVTAHNGACADAGRYLPAWVRSAGFRDVSVSGSNWVYADAQTRAWWGDLWADRVVLSSFAEQAVAAGLADTAALTDLAEGWRAWSRADGGCFVVVHVEVLARR